MPEGLLLPGANTLLVQLPGDTGVDFDLVDVDAFTVDYPRHLVARDGRLDFTAAGAAFEVQGLPSADIVVYRQIGETFERLAGGVVAPVGPGNYSVTFPGQPEAARYLVASAGSSLVPGLSPARQPSDLESGPAELLVISHPDFTDGLAPLVQQRESQGWSVKVVDVEDVYAAVRRRHLRSRGHPRATSPSRSPTSRPGPCCWSAATPTTIATTSATAV